MQIGSLKVFCDLVDTGSFSRSAVINGVTQSAVSQQISALERAFKGPLLDRNQGKVKFVRLTRKGQMLYDSSKKILAVYSSLIQQMEDSPTEAGPNEQTGSAKINSPSCAMRNDTSADDLQI